MNVFAKSTGGLWRAILLFTALLAGLGLSGAASAQLIFHFQEVGGDVTMTPIGSIDTALLQPATAQSWGGVGIEANATPESDIMGDTTADDTDTGFGFSSGTDFSAWETDTAPWTSDYFGWATTVTTPFSTYVTDPDRDPGLQVRASDLNAGHFEVNGSWIAASETFASLSLVPGTYTVSDASTGAFITIQIGGVIAQPATPVPALSLWALILLLAAFGWIAYRRVRV